MLSGGRLALENNLAQFWQHLPGKHDPGPLRQDKARHCDLGYLFSRLLSGTGGGAAERVCAQVPCQGARLEPGLVRPRGHGHAAPCSLSLLAVRLP